MLVAVGALLVGSIHLSPAEGEHVTKGQDIGHFAYGGSTVIVLFPKEMDVKFDKDISDWSCEEYETLLKVGQGIATGKG